MKVEYWEHYSFPDLKRLAYYAVDGEGFVRKFSSLEDYLNRLEDELRREKTPAEKANRLISSLELLNLEICDLKEALVYSGRLLPNLSRALSLGLLKEAEVLAGQVKEEEAGRFQVNALSLVERAEVVKVVPSEEFPCFLSELEEIFSLVEGTALFKVPVLLKETLFWEEFLKEALVNQALLSKREEISRFQNLRLNSYEGTFIEAEVSLVGLGTEGHLSKALALMEISPPLLKDAFSPVYCEISCDGVPMGFKVSNPFGYHSQAYYSLFKKRLEEGESTVSLLENLKEEVETYYSSHPLKREVETEPEEDLEDEITY